MNVFECVKKLHHEELYADATKLGSFLVSLITHQAEQFSPIVGYQSFVYLGDSYYELDRYKTAQEHYYRALSQLRGAKLGGGASFGTVDCPSEAEVRYRLYRCLVRQKNQHEAVGVLEAIPAKNRPAKVRAALAALYGQQHAVGPTPALLNPHSSRPRATASAAYTNYQSLLADFPFAIESYRRWLSLGGVSDEEAATMSGRGGAGGTAPTLFAGSSTDWSVVWLEAEASLARHDYRSAVQRLRRLQSHPLVGQNVNVVTLLGRAYQLAGETDKAIDCYLKAFATESAHLERMDALASLLCEAKRIKELENLTQGLLRENGKTTESWIALGYYCRCLASSSGSSSRPRKVEGLGHLAKAIYFAHRACEISASEGASLSAGSTSLSSGLLLKGLVLLDAKKYSEAATHLHEALAVDKGCFELYEALVRCWLEQDRLKDARLVAKSCRDHLGMQSPRPLTLAATVLAKDAKTVEQAQSLLEAAVRHAPQLLSAVYLLVELYGRRGLDDKAIDLLRRQTAVHVEPQLNRLLGDFLSKTNRPAEAADSYRRAMALAPSDAPTEAALQGLDRLLGAATTPPPSASAVQLAPPRAPGRPPRGQTVHPASRIATQTIYVADEVAASTTSAPPTEMIQEDEFEDDELI